MTSHVSVASSRFAKIVTHVVGCFPPIEGLSDIRERSSFLSQLYVIFAV